MNERLQIALTRRGVTFDQLAEACGVDRKTAERWVKTTRVPHRRHRDAVADLLGMDAAVLWPNVHRHLPPELSGLDFIRAYPDRASVARETWNDLLESATEAIDVLVFSGTFLQQANPRIVEMLVDRAACGVTIRLCFGSPQGDAVKLRDREERLRGTLGAKVRASLSYFTDLADTENCSVRLHDVTVYASLFRYDDQMLVNTHVWGSPATANPVLHVRAAGKHSIFGKHLQSFDTIWEQAKPWHPGEDG